MINSIPMMNLQSYNQPQNLGGSSCPPAPESRLDERMEVVESNGGGAEVEVQRHSQTVQALRKYLQRKLSSEDSSSERESQSPQDTENHHRSFDTAEESKSTLTCSIVYANNHSSGRNNFPLQKQRSLDDYTHPSTTTPTPSAPTIIPDHRYLRTDLCAAILLSRCTFCDQSFELDDQLRTHLREKHWNYFFDNPTLSQEAACEALDLSMRKSPPEVTGSLPNLSVMQSFASTMAMFGMDSGGRGSKKVVKCATCGKAFSTKWNWKQHQKIHLRENLQACIQ